MKKNGFFIIERFMVDDLKLKGNELIIYGIISDFQKITHLLREVLITWLVG